MKKVVSALLAGALAFGLAVPAFADDESGVWTREIEGKGEIGVFNVIEETPYPRIDPVAAGDDEVTGNRGVENATITLFFPTGVTDPEDPSQTYAQNPDLYTKRELTVDSNAPIWEYDFSGDATIEASIVKGRYIYAYQQDADSKVNRSKRVMVEIGSGKGSDIDDEDENGGGVIVNPQTYLDVTLPKDFYWYINQDTNGDIKSPVHTITNNGTIYKDKNATVRVKLASFEPVNTSSTLLSRLNLNFVNKGSTGSELFNTINGIQTGTVVNDNLLGVITTDQSISFGFEGSLSGSLPSSETLGFKMVLNISVDDLY